MFIDDLFKLLGLMFGLKEKMVGRIIKFVVNVMVVFVNVISLVVFGIFVCLLM